MSVNTIIIKKYRAESEKGKTYTFKPSEHAQKYMENLDKWEKESEKRNIIVSGPRKYNKGE